MTPEQVAKSLSPAQQRVLCELPIKRPFRPAYFGQWSVLSCLKAKRLINSLSDGFDGMGKTAMHVITPRGLTVRNYIMEAKP